MRNSTLLYKYPAFRHDLSIRHHLLMSGEPRRSSRASRPPDRYTPLPPQSQPDRSLLSIETPTIKEEESGPEDQQGINTESEEECISPEQEELLEEDYSTPSLATDDMAPPITEDMQAVIDKAVADAVGAAVTAALAAARLSNSPAPRTDRSSRALTADLAPADNYYLPNLRSGAAFVEPSKIKYPKPPFSDHNGEVKYEAWKMMMKFFLEEHSGNFKDDNTVVRAYFKCTSGEAQLLILQHMNPDYSTDFKTAADVLRVLDDRFHDYNQIQSARRQYNKLEQGNMSYKDFKAKFTHYAVAGGIDNSRFFDDLCEKISPALKRDLRVEKYRMNKDFKTLDEFLSIADRETRNIQADEQALAKKNAANSVAFANDLRPALKKKSSWTSSTAPSGSPIESRSSSPVPLTIARRSSPAPATSLSPSDVTCYHCHKPGHVSPDCPEKRHQQRIDKSVSVMATGKEVGSDEMSGNC